jgi:hypothetical protein
MSGAAHDVVSQLEEALARRGLGASVDAVLDALDEVSGSASEALTAGETSFLLKHTDLTADDLTPHAYAEARWLVTGDRLQAARQSRESSLTTGEVTDLLGRSTSSIRRSKVAGDLYALPTGGGRPLRFPAWQFLGQKVVPGLRDVIPMFPRYMHPLSIQWFMTQPLEELDDQAPGQWLASGGDASAVVSLVDELSYE